MASVFGHAILAASSGVVLPKVLRKPKLIILGVLCSIFPDADVLGFRYGIRYGDLWGHRGMTHSILFGLLFGLVISLLFFYSYKNKDKLIVWAYLSFCAISHGILDGFTTGGMGVAYFSPFDTERYFLPYRVIRVSPLSISRFFDDWGWRVIESEAFWIGIPSVLFVVLVLVYKFVKSKL